MVVISHPTGSQFVRQALLALQEARLLDRFHTTVYWNSAWKINAFLPPSVRAELNRRSYPQAPGNRVRATPIREAARLMAQKFGVSAPSGASVLNVAHSLDRVTARTVSQCQPKAVYAYEGVALRTFQAAKRRGIKCIYELPSAYWYYEIELFREEAALRPEYADTLQKLKDPAEHNQWKDRELALADAIVIPSHHVLRTLQRLSLERNRLHIVPYGADESLAPVRKLGQSRNKKLRVLYVGSLTQRKGIGYLIDAITMLGNTCEFTFIGRPAGHALPLERALNRHRWVPSLPHPQILAEMATHDVLVMPSLSEGLGLVIGEALSRGLPVITTRNSGGEEIVREGEDGFFVPIRSARAIAERLEMLNTDRGLLDQMSASAVQRAGELSWTRYRSQLSTLLQSILAQ
jgi:glycosyltransferase involved in cell wall biosynthesis